MAFKPIIDGRAQAVPVPVYMSTDLPVYEELYEVFYASSERFEFLESQHTKDLNTPRKCSALGIAWLHLADDMELPLRRNVSNPEFFDSVAFRPWTNALSGAVKLAEELVPIARSLGNKLIALSRPENKDFPETAPFITAHWVECGAGETTNSEYSIPLSKFYEQAHYSYEPLASWAFWEARKLVLTCEEIYRTGVCIGSMPRSFIHHTQVEMPTNVFSSDSDSYSSLETSYDDSSSCSELTDEELAELTALSTPVAF